MGSVHSFRGRRAAPRRAASAGPRPARTAVRSSRRRTWCCAPRSAIRSTRPRPGSCPRWTTVEVYGYCFRHEPSTDPFRMQSFRQHDYVYLGTPDGARAHRDEWIGRGLDVLAGLGLEVELGGGQRPVLRSTGPDAGRQPALRGAQVRDGGAGVRVRTPDGHLVVELPPRPLLASVRHRRPPTGSRPTPPASASASTGSRWPSSTATAPTPAAWPAGVRSVLWP